MTRKLILFVGALILVLLAWTPSVEAIGPCSCFFCGINSTANCESGAGEICLCRDYYIANC
jgi:hypothetical protein